MDITEKLERFINSSEDKQNINEKDWYDISASDTMMSGKVVIDLSGLPDRTQKSALKNLENGNYSVDTIAGWLVVNI